jgi:hypothetical protein
VYLNYDRYDKITRAGSIFIAYGRGKNGTLSQVGGLKVNYNKWGVITSIRGVINPENRFKPYQVNPHNDNNCAYNNNRFDNDNNYYYYNRNVETKKQKKNK